MSAFDRFREALTGGPRYTPDVGPRASTRDQEKNAKVRAREARQAAGRRQRHREIVARGGSDGTPFGFEEKRRRFGRRS
ncbi:hypothetical protein PV518_44725 [Streptomyces sp. ND04-05B]|uniref:hypothetical protein n=1 Tax=Streptomyces sp. ND04-05B TaxID=3028693 RepID=UPI0029A7E7B4|nr:hypothetical protein [Streptomyces sp. ND04-05B]MDX3069165.1 hypothetical protein [Streptomyces sp. ND04-05B]